MIKRFKKWLQDSGAWSDPNGSEFDYGWMGPVISIILVLAFIIWCMIQK